jgi:ribosomal protein S18 acetylase RimI-like enzyme
MADIPSFGGEPRTDIRPYRPADQDATIALWRACGLVVPLNDPVQDIILCRQSGHGEILVGELDRRIVGSVMVGHDGHRGWLYYLAVTPELQQGGLGRRLVTEAEAWLRARGVPKVQLMIRDTNTEAADFYQRIGYLREPRIVMSRRLDGKAT